MTCNTQSAQSCGCDAGANHLCEIHAPHLTQGDGWSSGRPEEYCYDEEPIIPIAPDPEDVEYDVTDLLREFFPHGHPQFLPITLREMELHSVKNADYAGGGPALGNFDRVSAILALYPDLKLSDRRVVALVYALKQLDAVLWGINSNIVHKVEGLNARLQDISVYAKLVACMNLDSGTEGK